MRPSKIYGLLELGARSMDQLPHYAHHCTNKIRISKLDFLAIASGGIVVSHMALYCLVSM